MCNNSAPRSGDMSVAARFNAQIRDRNIFSSRQRRLNRSFQPSLTRREDLCHTDLRVKTRSYTHIAANAAQKIL